MWHTVAQLIEALQYELEGRAFDTDCFTGNFPYVPGFDSG
jgi:hypothetical protein